MVLLRVESPYVQWRDVNVSGKEHNWKLKFSMQTHLTYIIIPYI